MNDALLRLETLVERLRRDCPWDREQTFATLSTYLLEETHETLEAIHTLAAQSVQILEGQNKILALLQGRGGNR